MLKNNEFIFLLLTVLIFFCSSLLTFNFENIPSIKTVKASNKKILLKIDPQKLLSIKGIGKKTADLIKKNLSENNSIYLSDLKKIKGIGEKRVKLIFKRFYVNK